MQNAVERIYLHEVAFRKKVHSFIPMVIKLYLFNLQYNTWWCYDGGVERRVLMRQLRLYLCTKCERGRRWLHAKVLLIKSSRYQRWTEIEPPICKYSLSSKTHCLVRCSSYFVIHHENVPDIFGLIFNSGEFMWIIRGWLMIVKHKYVREVTVSKLE